MRMRLDASPANPRRLILTLLAISLIAGSVALGYWTIKGGGAVGADPTDPALVARGSVIYEGQCASCHGRELEGQADWRTRLPTGRLPAPPHDASGHTWHHTDAVLFDITKGGVQTHAPAGYQSDMPAFGGTLSDADIWATLSYIKSRWPKEIQQRHSAIDQSAKNQK
jgi:mono/diheme cytochrome c family protein